MIVRRPKPPEWPPTRPGEDVVDSVYARGAVLIALKCQLRDEHPAETKARLPESVFHGLVDRQRAGTLSRADLIAARAAAFGPDAMPLDGRVRPGPDFWRRYRETGRCDNLKKEDAA